MRLRVVCSLIFHLQSIPSSVSENEKKIIAYYNSNYATRSTACTMCFHSLITASKLAAREKNTVHNTHIYTLLINPLRFGTIITFAVIYTNNNTGWS